MSVADVGSMLTFIMIQRMSFNLVEFFHPLLNPVLVWTLMSNYSNVTLGSDADEDKDVLTIDAKVGPWLGKKRLNAP